MSDAKILLADDDEELCHLLSDFLVREGFTVDLAHDGENTLRLAAEGGYDALILDVMLPHRSGLDVLRDLRRGSHVPVLMLTALGEDIDRILGLDLGADDYVPKPCNPREIARLRDPAPHARRASTRLDDLSIGPVSHVPPRAA
jgi:two-component system response regulator CpxR